MDENVKIGIILGIIAILMFVLGFFIAVLR